MNTSLAAFKRLLRYNNRYRSQVYSAGVYSVLNKIFDIAPEILIGVAIDVVVSQQDSVLSKLGLHDPWQQIIVLAVLTFLIWAGESIFEYAYLLKWRGLSQRVQHDLRIDCYEHIQNLDLSYFEDQSTGNLVSIMNDDINQLERFLDGGINQIIQTVTAVIGVGAVFFFLSPPVAVFAFMPVPVVIIGAFYFQKRATPLYADIRDRVGRMSARLNNNISGIMTIKSFTTEKQEVKRLREESEQYLKANERAIAVSSAFIPVIRMAILSGFLVTFVFGASKVFQGELRVGSYGVLVFLTQRLLWPLTGLATVVDLYERAMASTHRVLDLLATPIRIKSGDLIGKDLDGRFEFQDVNFRYLTGNQVLHNISMDIPARKTTAFVGATGSGKSSLVKLLLRFYDMQSGNILLDGKSIEEYQIDFLRSRIALVSQETFLFHGTVLENIAYGSSDISFSEVEKAARLAEAHDFIINLPEKYETVIGERGQKLSGGQRQRLSIARAILKNPDVLILDEATSAVDNETEAAIQKSMAMISKGRTTIVIAHRLSTIVGADQIYVLDGGRIVEKGRHEELLQRRGPYFQLWAVQTGSALQAP